MKLEIKREWCLAAARREGDVEVGAGRIAFDPEPESAPPLNQPPQSLAPRLPLSPANRELQVRGRD